LLEQRGRRRAQPEGDDHVDLEGPAQIVEREALDRGALADQGSVVDEDVERAETGPDMIDDAIGRILVHQVDLQEGQLAHPARPHFLGRGLAVDGEDAGPALGELRRRRRADPACRAGDDRDETGEVRAHAHSK
jgi:hypothetical protein